MATGTANIGEERRFTSNANETVNCNRTNQPQIVRNETTYGQGVDLSIGDRVRIVNSKRGQAKIGVINGFSVDGKVKIDTNTGQVIIRMPKNICRIN